jgi:hypothetical protein
MTFKKAVKEDQKAEQVELVLQTPELGRCEPDPALNLFQYKTKPP